MAMDTDDEEDEEDMRRSSTPSPREQSDHAFTGGTWSAFQPDPDHEDGHFSPLDEKVGPCAPSVPCVQSYYDQAVAAATHRHVIRTGPWPPHRLVSAIASGPQFTPYTSLMILGKR